MINKARERLVKEAKRKGISLRQSYKFKGKKEAAKSARYFHAGQHKRGRASVKRQKTWLGRVIRDIKRKWAGGEAENLERALELGGRIYAQEKRSKGKIYSLHEVQVECLSKGKAQKPYEFGNKVSFTVTGKKSWIIGAKTFFGNPFDGKTLKEAVKQTEGLTGEEVGRIAVDRGYRGKANHPEGKETYVSGGKVKDTSVKRFLRRRSAIEPVIGHMKEEHRLGRNYLGGVEGDRMNPILAASAFNMQKLLRSFAAPFLYWLRKMDFFGFFSFLKGLFQTRLSKTKQEN